MIRVAVLEARPDRPTDAQELLYAFIALVTDCPIPRPGARRWCLDQTRHLAFWSRINGVQSYLCEDGSVFSFDYDARSVWAKPVGS